MSRVGNKFSVSDAAFDLVGGFGPGEGLGVLVPVVEEAGNGAFQFGHAVETAAADGLLTDHTEPALDEV